MAGGTWPHSCVDHLAESHLAQLSWKLSFISGQDVTVQLAGHSKDTQFEGSI